MHAGSLADIRYKRIWLYKEPLDFRKQINGLISCVIHDFEQDPMEGDLYVFLNRQRNRLKCLAWHKNGYFMGYKRLEKGRFEQIKTSETDIIFTDEEWNMFLSATPIYRVKSVTKGTHYAY